MFETVDMVDVNPIFLEHAKSFVGEESSRIDKLICSGLQDFTPEPSQYDVIWCQWVLGHLVDDDFVAFFRRCKTGLAPNGLIFVKDNMASGKEKDFDKEDSCYTRPLPDYVQLFKKSGLTILKQQKQKGFPKGLYDVYMFALK